MGNCCGPRDKTKLGESLTGRKGITKETPAKPQDLRTQVPAKGVTPEVKMRLETQNCIYQILNYYREDNTTLPIIVSDLHQIITEVYQKLKKVMIPVSFVSSPFSAQDNEIVMTLRPASHLKYTDPSLFQVLPSDHLAYSQTQSKFLLKEFTFALDNREEQARELKYHIIDNINNESLYLICGNQLIKQRGSVTLLFYKMNPEQAQIENSANITVKVQDLYNSTPSEYELLLNENVSYEQKLFKSSIAYSSPNQQHNNSLFLIYIKQEGFERYYVRSLADEFIAERDLIFDKAQTDPKYDHKHAREALGKKVFQSLNQEEMDVQVYLRNVVVNNDLQNILLIFCEQKN